MAATMTLPDEFDFHALLHERAFTGGTKIVVYETAQAVRTATGMDMQMVWVADIYERPRQQKPLIHIVDDSPSALFEQLGRIAAMGRLDIKAMREAKRT